MQNVYLLYKSVKATNSRNFILIGALACKGGRIDNLKNQKKILINIIDKTLMQMQVSKLSIKNCDQTKLLVVPITVCIKYILYGIRDSGTQGVPPYIG